MCVCVRVVGCLGCCGLTACVGNSGFGEGGGLCTALEVKAAFAKECHAEFSLIKRE